MIPRVARANVLSSQAKQA